MIRLFRNVWSCYGRRKPLSQNHRFIQISWSRRKWRRRWSSPFFRQSFWYLRKIIKFNIFRLCRIKIHLFFTTQIWNLVWDGKDQILQLDWKKWIEKKKKPPVLPILSGQIPVRSLLFQVKNQSEFWKITKFEFGRRFRISLLILCVNQDQAPW